MSIYKMDDGIVVDTDLAAQSWKEDTRWDGNNNVSIATGSQWDHERLYRSSKGRYYVEWTSQYQRSTPHARWLTNRAAAAWLLANDHPIPDDLKADAAQVLE